VTTLLGVKCLPKDYVFSFQMQLLLGGKIFKRKLINIIARIFDLIEFLAPYIITAKILILEVSILGEEWAYELSKMGKTG